MKFCKHLKNSVYFSSSDLVNYVSQGDEKHLFQLIVCPLNVLVKISSNNLKKFILFILLNLNNLYYLQSYSTNQVKCKVLT